MILEFEQIVAWLRERDPRRLESLWREADQVRRASVGDAVHLRGLVEISSWCARNCSYCGIRAGNAALPRYRLTAEEILDAARTAHRLGFGSVVLQSGEDPALSGGFLRDVVRSIKDATGLAITLSLGELDDAMLAGLREAGADRYLLRFETSNRRLFAQIHPPRPGHPAGDRIAQLARLRGLGFEVGSGVMVGIPGQTYEDLAHDVQLFRTLDLDMIGVGPYVPHPETPLGQLAAALRAETEDQAEADIETTCKVVALARLVCPRANIPSTTALATIGGVDGRALGLLRGANVVMPNLTPQRYRESYQIYPNKAGSRDGPSESCEVVLRQIAALGRFPGRGPGDSPNAIRRQNVAASC